MSEIKSQNTASVTEANNARSNKRDDVALAGAPVSDTEGPSVDEIQALLFDIPAGLSKFPVAFNTFILDIAGFTGETGLVLEGLGEDHEIEITFGELLAGGREQVLRNDATAASPQSRN